MRRGVFQPATLGLLSLAWVTERRLLCGLGVTMLIGFAGTPVFMVLVGAAVGEIPHGASAVVPWALAAGAVFVGMQTAGQLRQTGGEVLGQRLGTHLRDRALAACAIAGLDHLDTPESRDDLAVVSGAARGLPLDRATMGLAEVVTAGLGTVGALVVLLWFHVWVALGLTLVWAGARLVVTRENHRRMELLFGQATQLRRAEYLRRLAVRPAAAKEVRVFGLGDWLLGRLHEAWTASVGRTWDARRPGSRRVLLLSAGLLTVYAAVFVLLARQAAAGDVSPAAFAVFFQALVATANVFGGSAAYGLDVALAPLTAVRRLEDRRAALPAGGEPCPPLGTAIEAHDVHFRYGPGREALAGVSLRIGAGESVALVGANGAGKTTMLRMLAGFAEPQAGRITIDCRDLAGVDKHGWRRQLAMVAQDFTRLPLPIADNVTLLRYPADDAAIRECLRAAGLDDAEPDAEPNLSGGQWQRLALARAFYAVRHGARVLVLDEPTANVDVNGELELFDRLLAAAQGLTTVVVSHRFATVRKMRRIVVLDEGRVVEHGSHDELMALGGRYHAMFRAQAEPFMTTRGGA